MSKSVVCAVALSVACLSTLASSVSADPVRVPPGQVKLNLFEVQTSQLSNIGKADIRGLLSEHFANNNGNHFGFRNQLSGDFAASNNGRHVGSINDVSDPFAGNNGKHQGFSVASNRGGLRFGLTDPRNPSRTVSDGNSKGSVTQSPEPTGMLLLGTGLAAGAAFLRRRMRRNRRRTVEE